MILPTMNDDEKTYEAFRMTTWLCDCMDEWKPKVIERFRKGTKFPYFQRGKVTDDKGNEWICLFYILTKSQKKKGVFYTVAYTVYDIPRKYKENDANCGKGVLMLDPYAMQRKIDGVGIQNAVVTDIVPHAFNRYTQRYLKPIGKENIEFGYKVESMLKRWQWFDISADIFGDKNAEKHMEGNICPYDVIMRGGGMLRGQIVNSMLLRFTTYVSEEMMFDNQVERHDEMVKEYMRFKRKGLITDLGCD